MFRTINEIRDELSELIETLDLKDDFAFARIISLLNDYSRRILLLERSLERSQHDDFYWYLEGVLYQKQMERIELLYGVNTNATATLNSSAQSENENAPANATPGHLRLRSLLVKVPAFFETPITQARLSVPLPHGPNQPATKLICNFG